MGRKPQVVVGLDAGSSRTRCVIGLLEDDHIRLLSYGLAHSSGWQKGRIVDQEAAGSSMKAAVEDAARGAGVSVPAVTLGMGGNSIRGAQSRGLYEFGHLHELTAQDLSYSVDQACEVLLERDRMVLHALPQDFTLDGRAGFRKPLKAVCSRLEANVHIITASQQEHHALVAAAYACVLPEERARGVAVIDLGMESTGLVVYDGERLLLASCIPVSSGHLTRDVAYMFKIAYEDAESLKLEYGCAMLGLTSETTLIEVPSPEGRAPREALRSELIEILEARAEQLFRNVRGEIQRSGMDRNLLEGVILTGAGAELPGMWDMAERQLDCQACHGIAKGMGDWPAELNTPAWTTAAGLAMYAAKLKQKRPQQKRPGGLIGLVTR